MLIEDFTIEIKKAHSQHTKPIRKSIKGIFDYLKNQESPYDFDVTIWRMAPNENWEFNVLTGDEFLKAFEAFLTY